MLCVNVSLTAFARRTTTSYLNSISYIFYQSQQQQKKYVSHPKMVNTKKIAHGKATYPEA